MLDSGSQLGRFKIIGLLGAGGMGEVWRAHDPRLGRDVALKRLPDDFLRDPERRARFERETQVLAALNHPNIGSLYESVALPESHVLVLELVEGQTLAERIAAGPLPVPEALRIATQIAAALAAAHDQGIVHRDLKGGNVRIRPEGTVKLIDFGLAKVLDPTLASGAATDVTLTVQGVPAGAPGRVMGSPAYMSPEQARGLTVDRRTDIWAFGCLLYEMLCGTRAFAGDSSQEVLAKILEREPDFSLLPPELPRQVDRLVRRCLEKDLHLRLRDIGDARMELVDALARPEISPLTGPQVAADAYSSRGRTIAITVVLLIIAGAVVWTVTRKGNEQSASPAASATAVQATVTLAVLPFINMSSDPEQEYFADGLSEELLNQLAQIRDIRVAGRTSSFSFKGTNDNLRVIGEKLGVENILEGSVRRSGDQLRITTQLINAETGFHLWSQTYDRPLTDIFAIQDDISRSVAGALQVTLGVGVGREPGMTRNIEAYQAWLAARGVIYTGVASMRQHIELLLQAVALDPVFAQPWWDLSKAYSSVLSGTAADAVDRQRKADAAFAEYRRLLADSPRIHERLAEDSIESGQMVAAAEHYQAAADAANRFYGGRPPPLDIIGQGKTPIGFADLVGRPRESIALFEQARARDPLNVVVALWLAYLYGTIGDFPAAFVEFERSETLGQDARLTQVALRIALASRDRKLVLPWLDKRIEYERSQGIDFSSRMKSLLDKPDEALAVLRPLVGGPGNAFLTPWLAWFGDYGTALDSMRKDFQRPGYRYAALWWIWDPGLAGVRKLPGFKQLMRDAGLVDYWRKYGWSDYCTPTAGDDFECH